MYTVFRFYIFTYINGFLFCSIGYNSLLSLFVLILELPQIWSVESSFAVVLCSLDIDLSFCEHIFIFWDYKMFQAYLVLS